MLFPIKDYIFYMYDNWHVHKTEKFHYPISDVILKCEKELVKSGCKTPTYSWRVFVNVMCVCVWFFFFLLSLFVTLYLFLHLTVMHSSTFGKGWVGMSACPLVVLACESLHVCTVCIWRCEHARFCVEVFYALYINFHSFIHYGVHVMVSRKILL